MSVSHSPSTKLAGQSAYFLAGNVFTLIAGFAFQVYLANQLGAEGLGLFGLYEAAIATLVGLLSFGLAPTAVKFIPHFMVNSSYSAVRHFLRIGFRFLLLVGGGGYLMLLFVSIAGPWVFPAYADILGPLPVMGFMLPLGLMLFFSTQSLRGFHDIRYIVMGSSFLQLTAKIIFTVILFKLGYQLIGYIWAVVLSSLVALLWMLKGLERHRRGMSGNSIDEDPKANEKSWHGYAKVMYGNSLLSVVAAQLDRFLIGFFVGASGVGVLMTVKILQQLPGIFLQMFLAILAPMFSAAYAKDDFAGIQKLYCITTDWLMRLSLPLLIFLAVFAGPVLGMYGATFRENGVYPLYILLVAQLINLGCGPIGNVLNMSGLERPMFRITIVQTIVFVACLSILAPFYGIVGAAVAILISVSFNNFAAMYVASKKLSLKWWEARYNQWLVPIGASLVFCAVIVNLFDNIGKIELLLYLICNYAVFHLLHLAFGINEDDKEVLREFKKKFFHRKVCDG